MPYCPECRTEFRPGVTQCSDCGRSLLAGAAPSEKEETLSAAETEPVLLCRVADPAEAEMIRSSLADAGIACVVEEQGPIAGLLSTVSGDASEDYATILVSKNRLAEARRVLAETTAQPITWPEGEEPED
jgi:hypothetical protein